MSRLAIAGGSPVRTKPYPPWPIPDVSEERELLEVLYSGRWSVGSDKIKRFEEEFAAFQHAKHGVTCSSGSTGLLISLKSLGVGPGDEVIVPAYTFLATVTSVIDSGATPVYADIDRDTYCLSCEYIDRLITERTKCIVPVHMAGCPANMDRIINIAKKNGIAVLEDAAQAHGAEWNGRRVGAIGDMGVFSFYQSKNMTAGEGGCITTNDDRLAELARSLQNVGRDLKAGWYEHVRYGWNFRMTAFQAALLHAQLGRMPELMEKRERSAAYLTSKLNHLEGVRPLRRPEEVTSHSYHLYIFRVSPEAFGFKDKEEFVKALKAEGIPCSSGYRPVYSYPFIVERSGRPATPLPNTERASYDEAVWLPQNIFLGEREDLDDVVMALEKLKANG